MNLNERDLELAKTILSAYKLQKSYDNSVVIIFENPNKIIGSG